MISQDAGSCVYLRTLVSCESPVYVLSSCVSAMDEIDRVFTQQKYQTLEIVPSAAYVRQVQHYWLGEGRGGGLYILYRGDSL